jgi:peptidoglycan-associated lipoprotein
MRTVITTLIATFCCTIMLTTGCAKKDLVKTETPPSEVAVVTPVPPPPQPTPPTSPVAPEPVKENPVVVDKVTVTEEIAGLTEDEAASKLFQTIYFDLDAFTLSDAARDSLAKNAVAIKKNKNLKIQIQGNCDERGSDSYNLALGEKRAKAAYDYLINLGTPPNQLFVISYGKERPVDQGHDEAAWAKNRRDDFVVLK